MDYLARWTAIRDAYFQEAPTLVGEFGGDSLSPIFAEIDAQVAAGDGDALSALEERIRDQLHVLEPRLHELLDMVDEPSRDALLKLHDSVLDLRREFSQLVMERLLGECQVEGEPLDFAMEPVPSEPEE